MFKLILRLIDIINLVLLPNSDNLLDKVYNYHHHVEGFKKPLNILFLVCGMICHSSIEIIDL
jgi:hypothetical protein